MKLFPFEKLLDWYKDHGRTHLPWREYDWYSEKELGYRVWIAEIILQQTQAERCIGYFQKLIAKYPNIEMLASTKYEDFYPDYQWLGYYSRARNMLRSAQMVTEQYNGILPKDTLGLRELPGVGPYTAEAIRAFAYNTTTLSFDTNLLKIFSRYYYGDKTHPLSSSEKTSLLIQLEETGISGRDINNACMDFATMVSLNSLEKIDWKNYPLKDCKLYQTRGKLEPVKQKKGLSFPTKEAHIIVILHKDHDEYYSTNIKEYTPFILSPTNTQTRQYVQEYFRITYGLETSVRPVHKKEYLKNTPYMVCYAQIQTGDALQFYKYKGIKQKQDKIIEKIQF